MTIIEVSKTSAFWFGFHFTKGAIAAIGIALLAAAVSVFIFSVVMAQFDLGIDDSDLDGRHRSGVSIVTDYKTGLQYLRTPSGGITPRLGVDGRQLSIEVLK